MKFIELLLLLLCLQASAKVPVLANAGLPPQIPNMAFKWNPVQINGKSYLPLSDLEKFYNFDQLDINGEKIKLHTNQVELNLTTGTQTMQLNGVKFILSEPIRLNQNTPHIANLDLTTLIDPLIRPTAQLMPQLKTVVIDAGHGGHDQGSAKLESQYTLGLALQLRDALKKKGYAVVLTREKDVFVALETRIKTANAVADAILISLHFNSGNKKAHGFESFIMSARQPRATHAASLLLTTAIHSRCLVDLNRQPLDKAFKTIDRGIKRARFNVLSNCKHPVALIEAGFLSHKQEAAKIASDTYQKRLTHSIVEGIEAYQASLKVNNGL